MDAELGTGLHQYLKRFSAKVHIKTGESYHKYNKEVYEWCESYMGVKYKDWFMISQGTGKSNSIWIREAKRATFFRLKWNDIIEDSLDNPVK
jgi:hypothetical protein